jgi:hypothetical protein
MSPAVLIYVGLAVAQLVAVLIISGGGISIAGIVLAAGLFGYLYLGKPLAWWILAAMNSLGLLALAITLLSDLFSGGHVLWLNVSVLLVTTVAMEAALLSPGMRRHVASRGLRLAPRRAG